VPYSKRAVVDVPFGLTVPEIVAVVGPTEVIGPVVADGAAAAAEATSMSAAIASAATAAARRVMVVRVC
jgi:hypothetical protein